MQGGRWPSWSGLGLTGDGAALTDDGSGVEDSRLRFWPPESLLTGPVIYNLRSCSRATDLFALVALITPAPIDPLYCCLL